MQRRMSFGDPLPFDSGLLKIVLGASVGLYVLQLVLSSWVGLPVFEQLAWWPFDSGAFRPWQPLTAFLLNGPDPLGAFFTWLAFYFFLPPVEQSLGARGLGRAAALTVLVSIGLGLLLQLVGAIVGERPFSGPGPLLTALTVLFGFTRPNASILLFFVLPVRALWIAWGSGLLALLYFLSTRSLDSALWLSGWIGAWIWLRGDPFQGLRKRWLRFRYDRLNRRLRKLEVIEGGRGRGASSRDDGPIYH